MKNLLLFGMLLFSPLFAFSAWAAGPQVVVSIKPIHSLVTGVMQGVAEPQLLIKGGGSPHGYVLRPSEARALSKADLIVWVGPSLESFLEKPLATLAQEAQKIELMALLEGQLLPVRQGGVWEGHGHEQGEAMHDEHKDEHGHGETEHHEDHDVERNPHLWLSPVLAADVVSEVANLLIELDPRNKVAYETNAAQLRQRLAKLNQDLAEKLAPVADVPYVVFHDAYQYFESGYQLNAVGSITIDPERKPGVKRLLEMREKINSLNARCVFSEPQFEPKLVATIIEGTGARTGELDPIGAELEAGPEQYFQLMNQLVDDLLEGLR